MEVKKPLAEVLKELILPELEELSTRLSKVETELKVLSARQEEMSKRLSDINTHIIRLDSRMGRLDGRLDRLYEVIVRREEHEELKKKVFRLETASGVVREKKAT